MSKEDDANKCTATNDLFMTDEEILEYCNENEINEFEFRIYLADVRDGILPQPWWLA